MQSYFRTKCAKMEMFTLNIDIVVRCVVTYLKLLTWYIMVFIFYFKGLYMVDPKMAPVNKHRHFTVILFFCKKTFEVFS